MRDHGGNIDWAMAHFGGDPSRWIDLSTGINRVPYPMPAVSPAASQALPTRASIEALISAAARAYRWSGSILPMAGAQAAIQLLPRLITPGTARVLAPTYNEHAACLLAAGWQVEEVATLRDLAGADLAVVVNPNNPDGQSFAPSDLIALTDQVGHLVVDESFADPRPDLSLTSVGTHPENLYILRSFGKFFGLAGIRLGFVLGSAANVAKLAEISGPWPVSGIAIEVGQKALSDDTWAQETITRLRAETSEIDSMAKGKDWTLVGGTELFRLYKTPNAKEAQEHLARHHIWSRIFPWSQSCIRLGLPGSQDEWARLQEAMA
ncbi:Threonine-phosphate decarboxylase [Pelagimonas phthalicica]|uniref:threonine-phosphate decarboxylase n=1 Tax=Pelagimonas phthalicica TaxID=1037362 RepID=A0A238JCD7_9RHOB|nr:threonine-phosphate decarboxylase CobD [Pelagimonas phthalicica]TDS91290.1 L-threonine O-3-phosphate decarboxylase [Pelagimonas phthalicica]SMX28338.1 Threonine-phosphate decarboxylase [Pelagimonas phthalicica]